MGIKQVMYYEAPVCDLCGESLFVLEREVMEKNYKSSNEAQKDTEKNGWKFAGTKCVCPRCFKELCKD